MGVFSISDYSDHEEVVFCSDAKSGLKAIICIHNSNLGPALGGCRIWPYANEEDALRDVLRLSRGMTYKSAVAKLKLGGGKSVVIADPRTQKTPALLEALACSIDRINGRYIAAEDSGTNVEDIKYMSQFTKHVSGIMDKPTELGLRSGDPSPSKAYGVFVGIKAAVKSKFNRDELTGLKVAIQGVGHVGFDLAKQLTQAGAEIWVTDTHKQTLDKAVIELGAHVVSPQEIYSLDVDVFSPCAMGAILNDITIPLLKAPIVAGAANNQLALAKHGQDLFDCGVLYAPDYVINAGGIIDVYHENIGFNRDAVIQHIDGIYDTLMDIFKQSSEKNRSTNSVADSLAEDLFR